jgi:hypothetical protein
MDVNVISNFREYMGNAHFMRQLDREYIFPVEVYTVKENGKRELVRVEDPSA